MASIEAFTLPTCATPTPDLEDVHGVLAAATDTQDFAAGPFAGGVVLDRAALGATPEFGATFSPGGPALFQAIDAHMGGGEVRAWTVSESIPCPNCTDFRTKLFLWYPGAARAVVIEAGHGFDS
jgi:hypothetical protein